MLKIRRPLGRLIFNMGIAIPGKTVFLIETAPWYQTFNVSIKKALIVRKFKFLHINSSRSSDAYIDQYIKPFCFR